MLISGKRLRKQSLEIPRNTLYQSYLVILNGAYHLISGKTPQDGQIIFQH
jgi:hypothetical protein